MYKIYLDQGEAYGNLGDEAMLINAARRIREHLGDVQFIIPRKDGQPLPYVENVKFTVSPSDMVNKLARIFLPSVRFRNWLDYRINNPIPKIIDALLFHLSPLKDWRTFRDDLTSGDAVYCVGAANLNDFARY